MELTEYCNKQIKLHNNHKIEFHITQTVYVKDDKEQLPRRVVSVNLLPHSAVLYGISIGGEVDKYYGFELSDEEDTVKKTS